MKLIIFNKYFLINVLIYLLLIQFLLFLSCWLLSLFEFNNIFMIFTEFLFGLVYCVVSYIFVPINIIGILIEILMKKNIRYYVPNIMGYKAFIIYIIVTMSFCTSLWLLYDCTKPLTPIEIERLRYD